MKLLIPGLLFYSRTLPLFPTAGTSIPQSLGLETCHFSEQPLLVSFPTSHSSPAPNWTLNWPSQVVRQPQSWACCAHASHTTLLGHRPKDQFNATPLTLHCHDFLGEIQNCPLRILALLAKQIFHHPLKLRPSRELLTTVWF